MASMGIAVLGLLIGAGALIVSVIVAIGQSS